MHSLNNTKVAQKWVVLVLLVFVSQLVSFSAHSSAMIGFSANAAIAKAPPCHGEENHSIPDEAEFSVKTESCCDGDCTMAGCHTTSAALNSVLSLSLISYSIFNASLGHSSTSVQQTSLYRPPRFNQT